MPELPFVQVLVDTLAPEVRGRTIASVVVASPSAVKTAAPPVTAAVGRRITAVGRRGKLVVLTLDGDLVLVVHLMRDGRLQVVPGRPHRLRLPRPVVLALRLDDGRDLRLTESGSRRRAGVYLLRAAEADRSEPLAGLGPEPLSDGFAVDAFARSLRSSPGQLKAVLTRQRVVAGIGNAYADDILWEARLSPFAPAARLTDGDVARLHAAVRGVLAEALERYRAHFGGRLPAAEPADLLRVHRRGGEPCPRCGTPIRVVYYADRETYYCPACQTAGRVYADRRLSRLLR